MELSLRHLIVSSASGAVLLDVPQLDLTPGTTLGIRGASGAGKSTLLHALMGLPEQISGDVIWGRTELLRMSNAARAAFRRRYMGVIFQDFRLFEEVSAQQNASVQAMFAPRRHRARLTTTATALLHDLGIRDQARAAATFSGGERQRIAVARALAHDPMIVLADEPTASLDAASGDRLATALLTRVRERGLTLVAVSHDEALLDRMDRVITLAYGRVANPYA